MQKPVFKTTLSNGLRVFLKEIHVAPITSHWVWYRVGSRNEMRGSTGCSHWVEHMQFKGTEEFPSTILEKAIPREGGYWNAFTYLDWTTYFETMPADKIDIAMRLEADRMLNSLFEPDQVASERTVIISERQGLENQPLFKLNEKMRSAAFLVHPYGHEVIGEMADLKKIQRDDLYDHYLKFYSPDNAVLSIAGDFETETMLARVRELYEQIPSRSQTNQLLEIEPKREEGIRLTVDGTGETTYIQVAFHVPESSHPDFFALIVLDSLLTGPKNLNMFGGGISNKTSRLYKALVDKELSVNVSGGLAPTIDPYLYTITTIPYPQRSEDDVLSVLDEEISKLIESPPSGEEVDRAMKQAKALFAYGSESITNQAFWMGFTEMFDSYDWFITYLDRLEKVTPGDIQRVAEAYLNHDHRIQGIYKPVKNGKSA